MNEPIAVLAGTLFDTAMGVDLLKENGLNPISCPVSSHPKEQLYFQNLSYEEKHDKLKEILENAKANGCKKALIYCNSLTGAADFPTLAKETGLTIITPHDAYKLYAKDLKLVGIIAAGAHGTIGIEMAMEKVNPTIETIGLHNTMIVPSIEEHVDPETLIEMYHIPEFCEFLIKNNAEGLILGCTHFPYFKEALSKKTSLKLIDPSMTMVELLKAD